MYVPSSELGLSHPLSRQRVCHSPPSQRGSTLACAGEGLAESQFRRLEKKLSTLPTLCSYLSLSVLRVYPRLILCHSPPSLSPLSSSSFLLSSLSSAPLFLRHYRKLAQSCGCHAKLFPALIGGPAQRSRIWYF